MFLRLSKNSFCSLISKVLFHHWPQQKSQKWELTQSITNRDKLFSVSLMFNLQFTQFTIRMLYSCQSHRQLNLQSPFSRVAGVPPPITQSPSITSRRLSPVEIYPNPRPSISSLFPTPVTILITTFSVRPPVWSQYSCCPGHSFGGTFLPKSPKIPPVQFAPSKMTR